MSTDPVKISFNQAQAGGVVNMVPHGESNPDKIPPGVIGGPDFPLEVRTLFPALIRLLFMAGALKLHSESGDKDKHDDVVEKMEGALMQLFMMQTKLHHGDCQANFDYWMELVAPEPKEEQK